MTLSHSEYCADLCANDGCECICHFRTDGYDSWSEFSSHNNQLSFLPHLPNVNSIKSVSFMAPDGGAVTLYYDKTWSYDCAPFYNGAS